MATKKLTTYVCVLPNGETVDILAADKASCGLVCQEEYGYFPKTISEKRIKKPFIPDANLSHKPFLDNQGLRDLQRSLSSEVA